MKRMFALLFAIAAPFGITEDSAGGAVAAEPAPPVVPPATLTDKINQYFDSGDKRQLQDVLLTIASENDALKLRLSDLEDSLGVH